MKKKDIHKELRNSLDVSLEDKFMTNLKWSMLFFCFNQISESINEDSEFKKQHVQKEFIKSWKKHAHNNITNSDLKIINDILNSPKNVFYSALQNKNEVTESTEIYQEKYNKILNRIEKFFLEALTVQQKFESSKDDEDDDDEEYA
jgi:hypothetical protein